MPDVVGAEIIPSRPEHIAAAPVLSRNHRAEPVHQRYKRPVPDKLVCPRRAVAGIPKPRNIHIKPHPVGRPLLIGRTAPGLQTLRYTYGQNIPLFGARIALGITHSRNTRLT